MDSRKPLTAAEIEELREVLRAYDEKQTEHNFRECAHVFIGCGQSLLSMLEKSYCVDGKNLHGHDCVNWPKRAWYAEARVQELLGEVERLKALLTPPTDAADVAEAVKRG